MFDHIRTLLYSDKIFDNPVLGKVSCGAFSDSLKECKTANHRAQGQDPCLELKQLSSKCYSSRNHDEMNQWIAAQFHESLMMFKFLRERGSSLPERLSRNSWAVFTNPANLEKYERLSSKQ